jgi:hypothetical protein
MQSMVRAHSSVIGFMEISLSLHWPVTFAATAGVPTDHAEFFILSMKLWLVNGLPVRAVARLLSVGAGHEKS